jgi:hypothetical protein
MKWFKNTKTNCVFLIENEEHIRNLLKHPDFEEVEKEKETPKKKGVTKK